MQEALGKKIAIDSSLPEFIFQTDGKDLSLRYDFGALRAFEKLTGVNPLIENFTITSANVDAFIWAGLHRNHPEVTLEQVQKWVTPATFRPLLGLVADAYAASFPRVEGDQEPTDPPSA